MLEKMSRTLEHLNSQLDEIHNIIMESDIHDIKREISDKILKLTSVNLLAFSTINSKIANSSLKHLALKVKTKKPLIIKAKGHGRRQRCRTDKFGFPKSHAPSEKFFQGFQTGDIVKATIPKGKYKGIYVGRIAIRFRPSFRMSTEKKKTFDVNPKHLQTIHKADGYEYQV